MAEIEISPVLRLENLDDFEIDPTHFNHGGFGYIQKGYIKSTKQKVVIKNPIPTNSASIRSLIQEYHMMIQCNHPVIQSVIGFYHPDDSDEYKLIMPYYEKGSLQDLINQKEIDNTQIFLIAIGVAYGMKYLHKNNIAHRDLKPNNILLNDLNYPILIDFGLSRNNIEEMSTEAGTLNYIAPEIFQRIQYNEKIDVYSYGLILNTMFSRIPPYFGVSIEDLARMKTQGVFQIHESIPDYLKKIIEKCINPDPSKRPSFKEIYNKLANKVLSGENSSIVVSFIKHARYGKKLKYLFRIPKQIIKIPSNDETWDYKTPCPIDWDNFEKVFKSSNGRKALLFMTFGNYQVGKSTFLRTITGNRAFYSGKGEETSTLGLLIDGPYKKDDLSIQIFDSYYKAEMEKIKIDDDVDIFFIDSQGIGETRYNDLKIVLDRVNSIFCSVSTACISMQTSDVTDVPLQNIIKTIRRVQFSGFTKIFLLIRGFQDFEALTSLSFNSIDDFQKTIKEKFLKRREFLNDYYAFKYLTYLPIGNLKSNYDSYFKSAWYSIIFLLSDTKDLKADKTTIVQDIKIKTIQLFGDYYKSAYESIILQKPNEVLSLIIKTNQHNEQIIRLCYAASYFLGIIIVSILELSQLENAEVDDLMDQIKANIYSVVNTILPYLFGEYNIPLQDFLQYSNEIFNDANSFMEAKSAEWKKHMKLENNAGKSFDTIFAVGKGTAYAGCVPIVGLPFSLISLGITCGFSLFKKISSNQRKEFKKPFEISFYPFIWRKNLKKTKPYDLDISVIKQIGREKDQLIVFYEQTNTNDSTLLFQALTGYQVDFSNQKNVSQLFTNVPIHSIMERFNRNKEIHKSKLENMRVNILYLKGCSQAQITSFCKTQKIKPIFISSLQSNHVLKIIPEKNHLFYLFYMKLNSFAFYRVNKLSFQQNFDTTLNQSLKEDIHMDHGILIPVESKDYDFDNAGPVAHMLIKYGCKLILQDEEMMQT